MRRNFVGPRPYRMVGIAVFGALVILLPATALAAGGLPVSAPAGASGDATYKAMSDTDPHTPLSAAEQQGINQKLQAATAHQVAKTLAMSPNYASNLIGKNQQGQQKGYWCGPAALSEALGLTPDALSDSQSHLASWLKTTTGGTAWSGVMANIPAAYQTGYPMRDVLDYEFIYNGLGNPQYYVKTVPYTPTSTDTSNFIAALTYDVDTAWPLVGDAWEVAGYAHLTGHPTNQTIFHWFTLIGYQNYGNLTSYEDSATTVWSTVPAYTMNFTSKTLVLILGGRGYLI